MDVNEIRRNNFLDMLERFGGVTRLAEKFDCSKSYISQLKSTTLQDLIADENTAGAEFLDSLRKVPQQVD